MPNADGTKGMERGISNEIEGLEKNPSRNMKNDGTDVSYEIIEEKFDEVFEDTYTCHYDDLCEEELGVILDNHNFTELLYDYIKGGKVKISAKKAKIIIEKIGEEQ